MDVVRYEVGTNIDPKIEGVLTLARKRTSPFHTSSVVEARKASPALPPLVPDDVQEVPIEEANWEESTNMLPLEPVIKVYSHVTSPNYVMPWQMKATSEKVGSAFALSGRRILTNAHVVADHTYIAVKKFSGTQKYPAKVLSVAHDCDLALLTVTEDDFWTDITPLELGDVPHLQDTVAVVGYPTGGDTISVTRGVVSRIEPQRYAHASGHLLAVQIDAAINPGNSGGPVLKDDKVVGVAFQSLVNAENMGFIIPVPIIKHFLKDIELHGKYTGFGALGIQCQPMDNPQLRHFHKMARDITGVLVNHVEAVSKAKGVLQKDDVLLSIDGNRIANDGTVAFRKRERIFFDYVTSMKQVGEYCRLEILRNGEKQEVSVQLSPVQPLVPIHRFDQRPSFFIHGGLVFTPLTQPYLQEGSHFYFQYGEDWYNSSPRKLCMKALTEYMEEPDQEVVILSAVLVHEINYGYQQMTNLQLLRFNDQKIKNLKQLAKLVAANKQPYLRFDFDEHVRATCNTPALRHVTGRVIILEADAAKQAEEAILTRHRIPSPHSPDLFDKKEETDVV
ncbi:DegPtype protease [Acanthamoeba castellanii str. Neff]|uniref:DegPtype protease n=1 Tax=Acanthamoeba castellanii (strain ATCC 30010 / Neff) TaxID=1257118 RepID=L8H5P1_ACACF|nr:DegPtype protease [Acanthamoeba castellanii str. Neff]ELR20829.1 DegPtype protease [Acanthamoeba castellanii str. Neff]